MKKFRGKKCQRGFALMTVFLMTVVLLILVLSLISLTSHTLYRATAEVERSASVALAESAMNEAILMLMDDPSWGTDTDQDKLFLCSGGQDVTVARLKKSQSPVSSNNIFSFGEKGCYYITFKSGDPKFNGVNYFSVNNLSGTTPKNGWRGVNTVPPKTASIVITVAVGRTVKHLEVVLGQTVASGSMTNGSKGKMILKTDAITFRKAGTSNKTPNLHSNDSKNATSIILDDSGTGKTVIDNPVNATISAFGAIQKSTNLVDPNGKAVSSDFIKASQAVTKPIPEFNLQTFVSTITFQPDKIPSGMYKFNTTTNKLDYWQDGMSKKAAPFCSYATGSDIVPGLKFVYSTETITTTYYKDKKWQTKTTTFDLAKLEVSENLEVAFDPNNPKTPGATGNLMVEEASIDFTAADKTLYLPGEPNAVPDTDGNYENGNLTLAVWGTQTAQDAGWSQELVRGQGSICTMGRMDLWGDKIDTTGSDTGEKAFYSRGDVDLETIDRVSLNGLVYTNGNFTANIGFTNDEDNPRCAVCHEDKLDRADRCTRGMDRSYKNSELNKTLEINGALIAAGADPNSTSTSAGNINLWADDKFNLTFNDDVLQKLTTGSTSGSSGGFGIISWHEF